MSWCYILGLAIAGLLMAVQDSMGQEYCSDLTLPLGELFQEYPKQHVKTSASLKRKKVRTLDACLTLCLKTDDCYGVDWNRKRKPPKRTRCWLLVGEEEEMQFHRFVNHHRRVPCQDTVTTETISTESTATEISEDDKRTILDVHNKFRRQVQPTATNMVKMYWDDDIARDAQQLADTCPTGHDTGTERQEGAGLGIMIGQNLAWGYSDWSSAIAGWHNEVNDFMYGQGSTNGNAVGHYTQVVRDHATHIGCGYKYCPGSSMPTNFVCNYAFAQSDYTTPYKAGDTCGDCPDNCEDKLCDCGDLVCQNGGAMDPGTCACTCMSPFIGRDCTQKNCPPSDPGHCNTQWPPSYCDMYANVPGQCPYMCGVC